MTTRTYAWMSTLGGFAAVAPSPHLFAMVDKIRLTFRKRAALVGDRAIHFYDPLFTHAAGQVFVATTVWHSDAGRPMQTAIKIHQSGPRNAFAAMVHHR